LISLQIVLICHYLLFSQTLTFRHVSLSWQPTKPSSCKDSWELDISLDPGSRVLHQVSQASHQNKRYAAPGHFGLKGGKKKKEDKRILKWKEGSIFFS